MKVNNKNEELKVIKSKKIKTQPGNNCCILK